MQLSTASHQLNSALFFMLEQIGLTGLFNQKVKCENKLRKTRLSFPQASHSSDTFFLDSKLIFFFSAALLPTTLCSAPGSYLPSSCQPAQTAAQNSQTQRSWSSKKICCCRQLGRVSEISGLPQTAPREPCNPSCAFSKGIPAVSWVMLLGKGGAWSRSSMKEQLVLHLSHSSSSSKCPWVHIHHVPALSVNQTGKLSVHFLKLSSLGGGKRRHCPHLTAILGPRELALKEMSFPGHTA